MVKELNQYTGREQQMKGVVTKNTQLLVFGITLPRGHGHRGQLSGFVLVMISILFLDVSSLLRNYRPHSEKA